VARRSEGVHGFLERNFWPPYVAPAPGTTQPGASGEAPGAGAGTCAGAGTSRAVAAAAIRRGRIVDLQLSSWCEAVRAGRAWVPTHRVHPFVAKVRAAFARRWDWVPVRAQVGVRVRDWRLGTRADLVVRCVRTGALYLVEIKTASVYGGAWAHDNGQRFYVPLDGVVSCPLNHALAQLTVTLALVMRDERPLAAALRARLEGAYVVVVDAHSVRRYRMPAWCERLHDEALRRLSERARAPDSDVGGYPVTAPATRAVRTEAR